MQHLNKIIPSLALNLLKVGPDGDPWLFQTNESSDGDGRIQMQTVAILDSAKFSYDLDSKGQVFKCKPTVFIS